MSALMVEPTEGTSAASAGAFFGMPVTHSWTIDDLARLF
jgi:hypothetical protein